MEQPRGGVAMPAIRVRERGDEVRRGRLAELGRGTRREVLRCDAVDASAIVAGVKIEMRLQRFLQAFLLRWC